MSKEYERDWGLQASAEWRSEPPGDEEWQRLLPPDCRFATAAWVKAWAEHFLPYQNWRPPLRYLTVRSSDGRLRAVLPVATQKRFGISVVSLGGLYWPFRSPVIPANLMEMDTFTALAKAFTGSWPTLALRYGPVPEAHPGIAGLNVALQNEGWRIHSYKLGQAYSVTLPDTWQQFQDQLGKKLRTNTNYYERKMRREGDLEIRCIRNTTETTWARTIHELGMIEGKSWQRTKGGELRFFGERNQAFWTSLWSKPGFADMVCVWLMYFRGEPVSFCFCLDCAATRHIVANNYAEHVRAYSTGSVLYRYVFRDAIESGSIRAVNIGLGDTGYKSRWGARPSFHLLDWIAFRPGARGRLVALGHRIGRRFGALQVTRHRTAIMRTHESHPRVDY